MTRTHLKVEVALVIDHDDDADLTDILDDCDYDFTCDDPNADIVSTEIVDVVEIASAIQIPEQDYTETEIHDRLNLTRQHNEHLHRQ